MLGCLVLRGVLLQSRVLDTPFLDHRTGRVILLSEPSWANRLRLAQLLGARFSLQAPPSSLPCPLQTRLKQPAYESRRACRWSC